MTSLGIGLAVTQQRQKFSPSQLFGTSTAGGYYEISPSTTFTDTARTTPAQVGQAVALVLDQRNGAGVSRVLTEGFDYANTAAMIAAGWVDASDAPGSFTLSGGKGQFNTGSTARGRRAITSVAEKWYQVRFTVSANSVNLHIGSTAGGTDMLASTSYAVGTHSVFVKATGASTWLNFWQAAGAAPSALIDTISIDEYPAGNHLTQTTAASRPILRQDSGGYYYLEFDGVDDALERVFAISQPWDRISAIRQISWTLNDRIYYSPDNTVAGGLLQAGVSPTLYLADGTSQPFTSDLVIGTTGVITERHDNANSRIAVNDGSYSVAASGSNVPNGIRIGGRTGDGWGNFRLYSLLMIGRALSDAETVLARQHIAGKAGVTL